ncbi:MerR family transcriptional regulator [Amycolatopsis rhabdoformis]|uniref:MerR family transcriptional regulator n=1 Tax=Amycolatopsis rhabdoformis TaxID=1448059 RepID=A0ABZ1IIA6_9PSEU|nr:MerR family transcriptional regulator [Amycolatopsis rhabdoformis]WSE34185.1 MerR family transcriptional regulator [Amycolatopsis rhabdoformis]
MAEDDHRELLTIGALADATGVAASALRYWEKIDLLPRPTRTSGQRRYPASAIGLVRLVLLLRDAGFSLPDAKELLTTRAALPQSWRELQRRRLEELDDRIAHAQAAREEIAGGLAGVFGEPTG